MALKAKVASLDSVAEPLRGEYTKAEDGSFYLNVEGVDDMPAIAGLKTAKQQLLDEKKKIEDKLRAFGEDTPETIAELRKAAASGSPKDVKALEEKLAQTQTQAQLEIKKAEQAAADAAAAAEDYFLTSEITRTLGEAKGSPALLSHVMRERVQVQRVDGKMVAVVVDPKTKVARIKDAQSNPMTLSDVAAELKADPTYGRAFEASGRSGSGAEQGGAGGAAGATTVRAENGVIRVDPAKIMDRSVTVAAGA